MDIAFKCTRTACGQKLVVDDSYEGTPFTCPACGERLIVPESVKDVPAPKIKTVSPQKRANAFTFLTPEKVAKLLLNLLYAGVLFAALWYVCLKGHAEFVHHRNLPIIQELSDVGEFRKAPVANNDGTQVAFAKTTDDGLGIFVRDLSKNLSHQIATLMPPDNGGNFFSLHGWSTDNQYFVYGFELPDKISRQYQLTVCDGSSLKMVDAILLDSSAMDFCWTGTNSFAVRMGNAIIDYQLLTNDKGLYKGKRSNAFTVSEGKSTASAGTMTYCAGFGLVYAESQRLFHLDPITGTTSSMVTLPYKSAVEWLNSDATGQHVLFCQNNPTNKNRYLFSTDLLSKTTRQLTFEKEHTFNGRWLKDGGYAYVGNPGNSGYLAVKNADGTSRTNVFADGSIRAISITPDGKKILAIGSLTFGPNSIWQYDIQTDKLTEIVPAADKPMQYSKIIQPIKGYLRLADGSSASYYILPPRNFDHRKKYPAIIDGPTEGRWHLHSQLIANLDCYYVSVNRRGLSSSDNLDTATTDIWAVYENLLGKPTVNASQIYLNGFSQSTAAVATLLEEHPEAWKGAMLMSPGALPEIGAKTKKFPKVLISFGDGDMSSRSSGVYRFEDQACAKWIDVKVVLHKNEGHIFLSNSATRERMTAVADFLY